jgi:hypothetical protein
MLHGLWVDSEKLSERDALNLPGAKAAFYIRAAAFSTSSGEALMASRSLEKTFG